MLALEILTGTVFPGGGSVQVLLIPSVLPSVNPDFLVSSLTSIVSICCQLASAPVMVYRPMLAQCSRCDRYVSQLLVSEYGCSID
jgi:hypothetical protein